MVGAGHHDGHAVQGLIAWHSTPDDANVVDAWATIHFTELDASGHCPEPQQACSADVGVTAP